jgi:hypothetical protein
MAVTAARTRKPALQKKTTPAGPVHFAASTERTNAARSARAMQSSAAWNVEATTIVRSPPRAAFSAHASDVDPARQIVRTAPHARPTISSVIRDARARGRVRRPRSVTNRQASASAASAPKHAPGSSALPTNANASNASPTSRARSRSRAAGRPSASACDVDRTTIAGSPLRSATPRRSSVADERISERADGGDACPSVTTGTSRALRRGRRRSPR